MGLGGNINGRKRFVNVIDGKFTIRVPDGTEGAVKRELTNGENKGKMVSELQYTRLTGMITKILFETSKYGERIIIVVSDDIDYFFQIPWNSSIKNSIITRLPNVDFNKEVTFSSFLDKEKKINVVLIYQNDELVASAYTKENPNGMPEAKKTTVRGVEKWDFSEVEEFLYNVLMEQSKRVSKSE